MFSIVTTPESQQELHGAIQLDAVAQHLSDIEDDSLSVEPPSVRPGGGRKLHRPFHAAGIISVGLEVCSRSRRS